MKEVTKVVYEAFDGSVHQTAKACQEHEKVSGWRRLIGLTEQQIADAISGQDLELAEAIKTVGYQIARAFPSGERAAKRHAAKNGDEPELPEPVGRAPMNAVEAEQVRRGIA